MNILTYIMSLGSNKLRSKFSPLTGVQRLIPGVVGSDVKAVMEPSVIADTSNIKIYFTKSKSGTDNTICLATASTVKGAWTVSATPVVGMGYGGAPANRRAHCSHVFKTGADYYCFATNGYGLGGVGEDRNIYLYKSADGITFTDLGLILNKTAIGGAAGFGNVSIYPNLISGKYEMLVEASVSSVWKIYRFNSTSIESGWTYVNAVPSLEVVSGSMYGGMQHLYENGKWHIIYHYGSVSGNLPTVLGYATSSDLVTCTIQESPVFGIEVDVFGGGLTDQLADPFIFEVAGKSYMLAEYCTNGATFEAQMWLWEYDGTLNQLLNI